MPVGVGAQSAGATNAGYGFPTSQKPVLSTLTVGPSNAPTGARLIDPVAKDYVLGDNGALLGMTPGQQAVYLATATVLNSSAVHGQGSDLQSLDKITDNFRDAVEAKLRTALQPAVDAGIIQVNGFTAFAVGVKNGLQPGQSFGRLSWTDLTTGQEQESDV